MLRAGLVALRRFGVSVWFALVRHASLRGDTPGVRRYASLCVGSGCPVWLVMVRFAGVRECAASRHLLLPVEEPGLIWRVFSRTPGREIPDRLGSLSRYVALCRAACQGDPGGVRVIFSRVSGCIRAVWGLIGAGSGSVRAPGVPVPVLVYVLVQVARHGAVAVPRALSHCPAVKYGALL